MQEVVGPSRRGAIIDPQTEAIRLRNGVVRVDSLPFAYSATTRVVPWRFGPDTEDAIEVVVQAVNRGPEPVKVDYGACAVELFAYRSDVATQKPAWRSSLRSPWPGGYAIGCELYGAHAVVQPGATFQPREFTRSFPVDELLADSLPDGDYEFAARVRLNWGQSREIPAGRLSLALNRGALPTSRLTETITYEAEPAAIANEGKTLVFGGTATLTHGGGNLYNVSPACALQVLAFRDRAARDVLPPVRENWRSRAQPCAPPIEVRLQCGDSHRVESRVSPRQILGDSLPAGDYYFAVLFHANRRVLRLAAGSATLSREAASVPLRTAPSTADTVDVRELNQRCARVNRIRGRAP